MNSKLLSKYSKDWSMAFPDLACLKPHKMYRNVGPLVVGIELNSRPGYDSYEAYFVIAGLWRQDVKECLTKEVIFAGIQDSRNLQVILTSKNHQKEIQRAILAMKERYGQFLSGKFSVKDFMNLAENHQSTSRLSMCSTSYFVADLYLSMMCVALYGGEDALARTIMAKIEVTPWDIKHFSFWKVDVDEWKTSVLEIFQNRDLLVARIMERRADPLVRKLPQSELAG
jgi:hypothetical protein